jgi:hypothetical protein
MSTAESIKLVGRSDLTTGAGVAIADLGASGLISYAPTRHKQDSAVIHQNVIVNVDLNATLVSKALFVPTEGVWNLVKATSIRRVVGGASTGDVKVSASGATPASGTTCLATTVTFNAPAADIILNTALATTPTKCGVGQYFGFDVTGTLTGLVGVLTLEFQRVT